MTSHPIDIAILDGSAVAKGGVRSYEKNYVRLRFDAPSTVNSTKLTGQFGGIYVASLQAYFDIDTSDFTTPDDGVNCLIDFDGNRFKRVQLSSIPSQTKITAAGNVTLADNCEDIIVIAKTVGAATQVAMPNAAVRTKPVRIVDGKYDAATNNITVVPKAASGQLIMGGASYIIDSNGASITLTPLADGSGWI